MKFGLALVILATATATAGAFGQKPKASQPLTCPVCHMPLSMKKTAADPVAVKLTPKSKVMYCCAKCKMPASVLVKVKKK